MNIENLSVADGLTIADIDKLTRVPSHLAHLFDDVAVFKAELKMACENLSRSEALMAMMLTDQTEASMKAIRLETAEISKKMNAVMRNRFTLPSGQGDFKAMMIWGTVMALFSDKSALTNQQRDMLVETGALRDLLHSRVAQ